jgi:glucose/arabinose dehydrogenase
MKQQGLLWGCACAVAAIVGCGGSPAPPSSGGPGSSGGNITGRERLGWNQSAASNDELATYRYAAYVDNIRSELTEVSCTAGDSTFSCSSRMPSMSNGSHTIELVSFVVDGGTVVESARSAALSVTVTGLTPDGASAGSATNGSNAASDSAADKVTGRDITTRDGVQLRADVLADGFDAPTGIASTPDGRVFVAERGGRIRIVSGGRIEATSDLLDDVAVIGSADGGLVGLALAPDFDRTHHVYTLYTVLDRDAQPAFRAARFRETAGAFAERVVLLDGVPASTVPSGAISIGPDGLLYVAFDDGGDPSRSASPASYNGKVLRLNLDGTTPVDQPGSSPVYGGGLRAPRALDWQASTGLLWIVDQRSGAAGELRGMRDSRSSAKDVTRARIPLSPRTGASSMAFYDGALVTAFRGDLLVTGAASRQLVRFQFEPRDAMRPASTEALLADAFDAMTAVAVGADGAIYLTTDTALVRLSPKK